MNTNANDDSSRKRSRQQSPLSVSQVSKEKLDQLKEKAETLERYEKAETNPELRELLHLARLLASLDYGKCKLANLSFSTGSESSPGTLLRQPSQPANKPEPPSSAPSPSIPK